MANLKEATTEELAAELERRKVKATERIQPLATPDFSQLQKMLGDFVTDVMKGDDVDSDWKHYIYEAAIEAVYGKEFWTWRRNFPG